MRNEKLYKKVDLLFKVLCVVVPIVAISWYIYDPYIWCVEVEAKPNLMNLTYDAEDVGKFCYKTTGEQAEHVKYLKDKYLGNVSNTNIPVVSNYNFSILD